MPDLAFIVDLPEELTLSAGKVTSRIQLAKTGKFKDPRYGNFAITEQMFDKWCANFETLSSPAVGRRGIPVDFDHNPEKRGDTEAAGWITKLIRKAGELWGEVEWTKAGQDAVAEGRYAYISPSYAHNYADEEGKLHGTHLVGAALTNRPFLRMATVSLSAAPAFAEEVRDSPGHMPELTKEFLTSLGLDDEKATACLAAEDPGAAVKVALAEVAKPEPAPAPPEEPKYAGKTLAELAAEQGMVIMPGADVAKLAADAAAGAAAAVTLHANRFDTAWEQAVSKGKVLPVSKAAFELAYGADADATLKQLSELPEDTIPVRMRGTGDAPKDDQPATLSADTKAAQRQLADGGVKVSVDADREKQAQRLETLLAEGKSEDEAFAIIIAEDEGKVA